MLEKNENWNKKRVKIVATLGPSSSNRDKIKNLALDGVDIFRLNLSHQSREDALKTLGVIKSVEKELKRPVAVMADLAGTKIRIGSVEDEEDAFLETGSRVTITSKEVVNNKNLLSVNFPSILRDLKKRTTIFLGDGNVILKVVRAGKKEATAKVIVGGSIRSHMGFLAQGMVFSDDTFPKKDKDDLRFLAKNGVTAFAASFVQNGDDVKKVKAALPRGCKDAVVIAKIETKPAVDNCEEIIEEADGVLVARGDLGLSIPMERVPSVQAQLIDVATRKSKPIITATQMLESMTQNALPTRAEVTDVTKAIVDGTDAVMFSAETATGKFPQKTVQMATAIIKETEDLPVRKSEIEYSKTSEAVGHSAVRTADELGAKFIIALTETGKTALNISRLRGGYPILAITRHDTAVSRLAFARGVYPILGHNPKFNDFDDLVKTTQKIAKDNPVKKLKKGDVFVVCAGVPFGKSGGTNLVFVGKV